MPPLTKVAQPRRIIFDPWNTVSTGHQHAENRLSGSTSWRDSRILKLNAQFRSKTPQGDGGGGPRISDKVGAGSEAYGDDGRTENGWDKSVRGWRGRQGIAGEGWGDVGVMMMSGATTKTLRREEQDDEDDVPPSAQPLLPSDDDEDNDDDDDDDDQNDKDAAPSKVTAPAPAQIFQSLTILINGSTYPIISDHKLKSLLTAHGARLSISHARRQVTHVILGRPNSAGTINHHNHHNHHNHPAAAAANKNKSKGAGAGAGAGAGGGLAAGKRQREILKKSTVGLGKGVRYVSVEWAMESVRAGARLPESRFPAGNVAPMGVESVRALFMAKRI